VTRRRLTIGLVVALLLFAGGAAAAVWLWQERHPGDIRGSSTEEFDTIEAPGATTRPEPEVAKEPWPTYGFDAQKTRFVPDFSHRPPYDRLWVVNGKSLLEFPPVVAYDHVYLGTNHGLFFAIDAKTGTISWQKDFKRCMAASPQVGDGAVYMPLMDASPCANHKESAPGYMVAMDAETGQTLWRFKAGVIESSPLLIDGILYFGSWDKKIYALDVETQKPLWTYGTGDKVKDGAAYARGTVFMGSYDGNVYALDARTGKLRWKSSAQSRLGGTGNWYATPAVAYGRVFIGNTDGKMYAFGVRSGKLLWVQGTGSYIYSSAAVYDRTVYAGSYDGNFYAFDAATGDVRWRFPTGGPISGAPTVMAGVVYFSTLKKKTYALDGKTGKKLWAFDDGQYSPLVADEEQVYLVGVKKVYGMESH
jgi:outer membrane protein assembly factor BamB